MRNVRKGRILDTKDLKEGKVEMRKGWIPEGVYEEIAKLVPILCVELVIHKGGKILLVKRERSPARGKWWVPGGGLLFGEKLEEAAVRIAAQEVGLKTKVVRRAGIAQMFFQKGYFGNPTHTVSVIFLMTLEQEEEMEVRLDFQSADYKWTSVIPKHLTHYFVDLPEISS